MFRTFENHSVLSDLLAYLKELPPPERASLALRRGQFLHILQTPSYTRRPNQHAPFEEEETLDPLASFLDEPVDLVDELELAWLRGAWR